MAACVQIKKEPGLSHSGPGSVGLPVDVKMESMYVEPPSSKAQLVSKVKLTLMQAWRERWTEIQWAIQLKKLLAAYSNDSVDIAEILMEQALVGSSPNQLILSYLKHSVLSLMIPFHSVMVYITNFEDFSRPHCVLALLRMTQVFGIKISLCNPCQDSPLQLVKTMLIMVHWLVKALYTCLQRLSDLRQGQMSPEYHEILDSSSRAIIAILERFHVKGLLQIAKMNSPEEYRKFEQSENNARGIMSQVPASALSKEAREKVNSALVLLSKLEEQELLNEAVLEVDQSPLVPTINGLVSLEAICNTNSDLQPFVDQVLLVSRLMKLPMSQLCLEIFRACFMGFSDTNDYPEGHYWAVFALLKVPNILKSIKQQLSNWEIQADVESGLNMLLEYSHLLDQTDIKSIDMLELFMTELLNAQIITEEQKSAFMAKRGEQRSRLRASDITRSNDSKNPGRVIQANQTLNTIIKSLDHDPQKNSDPLVKVLTIFLQGHSFEILLLVAAATGRLQDFMSKLIRINEMASQNSNDSTRTLNKIQLFDFTFVMMICTFQQHGLEIAATSRERESSLVFQWARRWLPERGRYKSCEVFSGEDQDKVDYLLKLMLSHSEIAPSGPIQSWRELIKLLPCALQEVIFAVEHKSINMEQVKEIIDNIRRQNMKSFIIVCATYLCSYINMVGASPQCNARAKPLRMLEMLISLQGIDLKQMLQAIVDNIVWDMLPDQPRRGMQVWRHTLATKENNQSQVTSQVLGSTLQEVLSRGWLHLESIHTMDHLMAVRGADYFCWEMLQHMLTKSPAEDSSQSLSLAVALLHFDLERLTVSLLKRHLPSLLLAPDAAQLVEPRGSVLAKLCVLAVTTTHMSKMGHKEPYVRRLHRNVADGDAEDEMEEIEPPPSKLQKMSEPQLTLGLEEIDLGAIADKEDTESLPIFDTREPLNTALANLFSMMSTILTGSKLSPRTWFIVSYLKEAIKCGGQHTRFILQFMPHNMLNQVIRTLPGIFSDDEILSICDLSTVAGRKSAAKAIAINSVTPRLDLMDLN